MRRSLEERIAELEAENVLLRNAAHSFGELAERLNEQLRTTKLSLEGHDAAVGSGNAPDTHNTLVGAPR